MEDIEKKLKNSHEDQQRRKEAQVVSAIKTNPKHFFAYAECVSRNNAQVRPLISEGKLEADPE